MPSRNSSLRVAKEGAEAANRTSRNSWPNMSHELRTPLNAVIGFSEMIKVEMFGPVGEPIALCHGYLQQRQSFARAHQRDSGPFENWKRGGFELFEENVDLAEMVEVVCISSNTGTEIEGSDFHRARSGGPPDPGRRSAYAAGLDQSSVQCVKFTPEGGKIRLSSFLKDGGLR